MENISEHITYDEATKSQTGTRLGILNVPNEEQLAAMKVVAEKCFEPARAKFGPLQVDSFFRCPELNKAVGGVATSQHIKGEAIDMFAGSAQKNAELFEWCKLNLIYDQLINEFNFSWVHVSFTANGHNRNQSFSIK